MNYLELNSSIIKSVENVDSEIFSKKDSEIYSKKITLEDDSFRFLFLDASPASDYYIPADVGIRKNYDPWFCHERELRGDVPVRSETKDRVSNHFADPAFDVDEICASGETEEWAIR